MTTPIALPLVSWDLKTLTNNYRRVLPETPAMESVKLDGGQASTNNSEPAGSAEPWDYRGCVEAGPASVLLLWNLFPSTIFPPLVFYPTFEIYKKLITMSQIYRHSNYRSGLTAVTSSLSLVPTNSLLHILLLIHRSLSWRNSSKPVAKVWIK